jgi:hypothetical protein
LRLVPHPFYIAGMPTRFRLCTSNDREALIDEMAAGAWEMAGYGGKSAITPI